ncbi:hypothetical protein E2542_SST01978 [Spatholobus suberectus]|nr:hypothetical protein E2542_SST01978 [Spatholobus suberectus]
MLLRCIASAIRVCKFSSWPSVLSGVACVVGMREGTEGYLFVVLVQSRVQLFAVSAAPITLTLLPNDLAGPHLSAYLALLDWHCNLQHVVPEYGAIAIFIGHMLCM